MVRIAYILAMVLLLVGCVNMKRIDLPVEDRGSNTVLIDQRPEEQKKYRNPKFRDEETAGKFWLGDENFVPSRLEYVASEFSKRFSDTSPVLTIDSFEIVAFLPYEFRAFDNPNSSVYSASNDWIIGELIGSYNGIEFQEQIDYPFIYGSSEKKFSAAIKEATMQLVEQAVKSVEEADKQLRAE